MKKHLIASILSVVLSFATAGTASAEIAIGTVDMKKVFESYWHTKEAETQMSEKRAVVKRDLDERNEKRKELQDKIEKLNDEIRKPEISKERAISKKKELDDKIAEWQGMMRDLQAYQAEQEKQLQDQTLRMRNGIVEEILKVVNEIRDAKHFDLVFDTSGNSINNVPVVISANPSYDFTKDVVEKLNATRPKTTAPETPAPAANKPASKPETKGKK